MSDVLSSTIKYASKQYPKLDDDELYDLLCNLNYQLQHRQPHSPMWFNYMGMQYPQDLISYQEILWKVKPTLVVETGTLGGGCTLFFAFILDSMMRLGRIPDYRIVTIDIRPDLSLHPELMAHPRINFLNGNSVSPETVEKVKSHWKPGMVTAVFLDDGHSMDDVLAEMEAYGPLVSVGSYMVAEDTCFGYYLPVGNGPLHAVEEYLKRHGEWEIDRFPERWLCTQHPCGWLRRVS